MPAVGALAAVGVERRVGQHRRVVLFLGRRGLVGDGRVDLLLRVVAAQDGTDRRARQRVVDALHRRQTDAERRALLIEQPPAREALHDRDADIVLLTDAVQMCARRVDAFEPRVKALGEHRVDILARREHVEGRVDAEQNHFHEAGLRRLHRDLRVVRAEADVVDDAGLFELHHVGKIVGVQDLLPLLLGVHVVDHAEVDVIGLQARQQILERRAHIDQIARAVILPVLPCRAEMALNVPVGAVIPDAQTDDVPGLRVRHPAVKNVDAGVGGVMDQLHTFFLRMALEPFRAEADLTDLQPCFPQSSRLHLRSS